MQHQRKKALLTAAANLPSVKFVSAILGEVQHPINILQEYLAAFGNKCQAAILSWLDNWTRTKRKQALGDWVWVVLQDLATELGYCKDTIFRHLQRLLEMGVIERQRAKRWSTDRAWKYRIVKSKLADYIDLHENQTIDISESVHRESEASTSTVQKQDNYIDPVPDTSYPQPQTSCAVEEEEVEKPDEPTNEEIGIVCTQIRALSPELQINQSVRSAIRLNWANVPSALFALKNAIRTWKVRPDFNWTGLLVKTLKTGVTQDGDKIAVKEYPRPSLEQLEQLGLIGELIYTALNEPGYPEVLAVEVEGSAIVWWEALAQLGGGA